VGLEEKVSSSADLVGPSAPKEIARPKGAGHRAPDGLRCRLDVALRERAQELQGIEEIRLAHTVGANEARQRSKADRDVAQGS